MRYLLFSYALLSGFIIVGQDRSAAILDYINNPAEVFAPEKTITGLCFIILADDFDYYKNPVVLKEANGAEILKITTENSLLITTYKGKSNDTYDNTHAFKPWLFIDNPDYFRVAFECIDTTGSFYKVRLNETDYTLIEKKDPNFRKQMIPDFVST
jgi:hypothetical protein